MSASPHKRSHSRSDAPVAGEAPNNAPTSLKSSMERPVGSNERRQLASHKSSAALYISSVLASSSTSTPDSPTAGAKVKDSIHRAAERGNTEVVLAFLKKKKAASNSRNELGHTPLHIAALHNCYDVVDILLRNDADPNIQDNIGWSALHFACSGKNEKLIQLLLDCPKIDVNALNDSANTPLHYAVKSLLGMSRTTLKSFVERGANVNAQNSLGETPIHGAALKANYITIERLIELGAKIDIPTKSGETALNWATKGGDEKTISVLLRSHKSDSPTMQNDRHSARLSLSFPTTSSPASGGHSMQRSSSKTEVHTSPVADSDLRYELTFMGPEEIVLDDDNWDQCLYDGGMQLLVDSTEKVVLPTKPHMSSIKREDVPLSKLFHLYLVISGRNKTDPEIVHWIADFLTGPKKAYLLHLIDHFSYRIRVRAAGKAPATPPASNEPGFLIPGIGSIPRTPTLDVWKKPTEKDFNLYNTIFAPATPPSPYSPSSSSSSSSSSKSSVTTPTFPTAWLDEGPLSRDRSVSLWEHRTKVSSFHWEIAPSSLQVREMLGKGGFGTVYRAKWMGTDVAVKIVESEDMTSDDYREFLSEISMMSNLRHPNVLILLGGSLAPPNLYFVTEYMRQGSLDKVLQAYPHLDWRVKLSMSIEMARGLYYLHHQSPPILHRDLKSLNILVDENFHVKVADFGLSADKTEHLKMKMGTLNWVAPECFGVEGNVYDEKADMWSFGMILWEIIAGRIPFSGMSQLQILRRIDMHELENIPEHTDPRFEALIQWCWNTDPQRRPSIADALTILEEIAARP